MKKLITGILIGSALTMSVTAFADSIKQYILTEVSYPLVVNGKEYKDAAAPILNYEGSTYVPLAKLGDITGVNYKWNDEAKCVEIVTAAGGTTLGIGQDVTTLVPTKDGVRDAAAVLAEEEAIRKATEGTKAEYTSGFVEDQGNKVFHAYDVTGKFMGRFTDGDDVAQTEYQMSLQRIGGKTSDDPAPPKFSDGWISDNLFKEIFQYQLAYDNSNLKILSKDGVELYRLMLPADWNSRTSGEASVSNVKLKKYDSSTYFNIEDLKKVGVIK